MPLTRRNKSQRSKYLASWCFALIFAVVSAQSVAHAKVVKDPTSGSYFELVDVIELTRGQRDRNTWEQANAAAEQRFHKGIRGRLAVIQSKKTHDFLKKSFDFSKEPTWIGLRYFCSNRKLAWVTGQTLKSETDFQLWHQRWARTNIRCDGAGYMPVYYTTSSFALSWQASGPGKGFGAYLVEYPVR